ncbi:hypothetical protein FOMPIDRAFT_1051870 [Fomitopsis schrenkii]|uniref:Uncharacterized protein n=1 Tax=Fomitopsis schrenkii TaxID=2126942 RepID=S8DZI4_FOMSC|nr:hypothetical protein FOMPIDRAFT_1051870 [Fomitopsis schrenkii]
MMEPANWTFMEISDLRDSALKARLQHHVDYLFALRAAWRNEFVVPGVWMSVTSDVQDEVTKNTCYTARRSREYSRGIIRLQLGLISDEISCLTNDELIDRANQDVVPHFSLSSERHVNSKILFNEWEHPSYKVKTPTHMSLHQVAQILQYQDLEVLAEHAITTALDGIPGAYVRREGVTDLHNYQPSGATLALAGSLDCALIHYPIGPSTPRSLEHLAHTPIGPANPALLLTMKGPAAWRPERGHSGREDTDLSSVLRKLALLAEPSLACLSDSWLRDSKGLCAAPPGSATTRLPACAMTIGVIYDANEINLIAHVPYTAHGKQRFLSLLFDTLPFPSTCTGSPSDFVRERYRVALALLSLQHHVFHLVTLAEPFAGVPVDSVAQRTAMRNRFEQLGWNPETPTPSYRSDDSYVNYCDDFDLDYICDESVDDGEPPLQDCTEGQSMRSCLSSVPSGIARYLNDSMISPPSMLDSPNIEESLSDDAAALTITSENRMTFLNVPATFQGATAQSPGSSYASDTTTKLIAHALNTLNSATIDRNWIGSLNTNEYPEHVPQFFSREDVTNEQRAAVLILLHSFAQSEQLARELASECPIAHTITRLFGPSRRYWIYSATSKNAGVHLDQLPFAVFLRGDPDVTVKDDTIDDVAVKDNAVIHARRFMARNLHRTLTVLASRHCAAHSWESNHVFTKADAELPMNEKFFVFSVFFARQIFHVDINFPVIELSEDKSTYTWRFYNAPVMQMVCAQPLPILARLSIFQALLFIEQHVRLLLKELGLEG